MASLGSNGNQAAAAGSVPRRILRSLPVPGWVVGVLTGDGEVFGIGISEGVPPASKAAIAALKEVEVSETESADDCAICLDRPVVSKETPCGHRFHGECVEKWLELHGSCPVCRYQLWTVPASMETEEEDEDDGAGIPSFLAILMARYLLSDVWREEMEEEQEEDLRVGWSTGALELNGSCPVCQDPLPAVPVPVETEEEDEDDGGRSPSALVVMMARLLLLDGGHEEMHTEMDDEEGEDLGGGFQYQLPVAPAPAEMEEEDEDDGCGCTNFLIAMMASYLLLDAWHEGMDQSEMEEEEEDGRLEHKVLARWT